MSNGTHGRDLTNDQVVRLVQSRITKKNLAIQELERLAREVQVENMELRRQLASAQLAVGAHAALLDELEEILKGEEEVNQEK